MPVILKTDIATKEATVTIQSDKGVVHFRGTENDLIQMIKDCHLMAESIQMDLDGGNIDGANEFIAIEQYQQFAKKY